MFISCRFELKMAAKNYFCELKFLELLVSLFLYKRYAILNASGAAALTE